MKRLFIRYTGNSILYVIIILSLLSFSVVGFLKIELILNETARVDLMRKQAEILCQSAFNKANGLIDNIRINGKTVIFDENLDSNNRIRANINPLKDNFFLLEALGISNKAESSIEAIYVKSKEMILTRDTFKNCIYINNDKQKFFDYSLRLDKPTVYFFENSTLELGKKMKLNVKNDILLASIQKNSFDITVDSPLTVDGNMEVFGNLVLNDTLDIKGKLIIHGNLKLNKMDNLITENNIIITGEILNIYNKHVKSDNKWKVEKISEESNNRERFYFLGFR